MRSMIWADVIGGKTRTVPTERSSPPAIITNVCPTERTRRIAALMASIEIEARPELLRTQRREDRDQRDQQNENPPPAKKLGPAFQRRDAFVVRFAQRGCAHAARSSTDPLVIAATKRSTLASCAENRATRRPRRRTSIRSATART